jgi:hypothetical protein
MLNNLTTRFARGTEATEENNFCPGGQKQTVLRALCVSSEAGGESNIQTAPGHVSIIITTFVKTI